MSEKYEGKLNFAPENEAEPYLAEVYEDELKLAPENEAEPDLAEVAIDSLSKQAIKIDELIARYPEGVTLNGCSVAYYQSTKTEVPEFYFAEDRSRKIYITCKELKKLFEGWLKACNGNVDKLHNLLKKKPQKYKFERMAPPSKFIKVIPVKNNGK